MRWTCSILPASSRWLLAVLGPWQSMDSFETVNRDIGIRSLNSILHWSSPAVPERPSRPTATDIWTQVEDQRGAYQTETETRRDERNQHRGSEASKYNE